VVFDYCVIGGGIVGLATTMELLKRRPGSRIVILEKESRVAQHQTGHNSGVIHSGIYYPPGSLKAELCRRGALATKSFCEEHGIPYEVCGKMLVATNTLEAERMKALFERAKKNNIDVEQLDAEELRRREPNIAGVGALFVRSTGIVDYGQVAETMGQVIRSLGGEIEFDINVDSIQESSAEVLVAAGERRWTAKRLVVCAGLQSDRLARIAGCKIEHQIVPFRGEYYRLRAARNGIVRHLIYPIPDPDLPFLGIHLTRMIDGGVTVGPNAVLGFAREGYPKLSFNLKDVCQYSVFPGFWKTIAANLKSGLIEMRNSLSKRGYLKKCQNIVLPLGWKTCFPKKPGFARRR
jgi:(S)-2-hydroxyglutarate dehydrogenase